MRQVHVVEAVGAVSHEALVGGQQARLPPAEGGVPGSRPPRGRVALRLPAVLPRSDGVHTDSCGTWAYLHPRERRLQPREPTRRCCAGAIEPLFGRCWLMPALLRHGQPPRDADCRHESERPSQSPGPSDSAIVVTKLATGQSRGCAHQPQSADLAHEGLWLIAVPTPALAVPKGLVRRWGPSDLRGRELELSPRTVPNHRSRGGCNWAGARRLPAAMPKTPQSPHLHRHRDALSEGSV